MKPLGISSRSRTVVNNLLGRLQCGYSPLWGTGMSYMTHSNTNLEEPNFLNATQKFLFDKFALPGHR